MEMTSVEPRSAPPSGTRPLDIPAARQRIELPEVPSHDFSAIQHNDPRSSHVFREVDNASLSSTAVNEVDPTFNGNPSQKILKGIQQTHTRPSPLSNSLAPTHLDRHFAGPQTQYETPREPPLSNALQASPKSASVSEPVAAAGGTLQKDMLEGTSRTQKPIIAQVNNETTPNLYDGPPGPESRQNGFIPSSHPAVPVADIPKLHKTAAWTGSESPELLSSKAYVVVEEEPPKEKQEMWEKETKRELDIFLHIVLKSIRKSMLVTRLCMAHMKGDEKKVARPVIIIACNTKKCRKEVRKHLSGKPSLRCLELFRVSIMVETVKLASLSDDDTPVGAPRSFVPVMTIGTVGNIKRKSDRSTYCGHNLRIEVWQDGVGKPSFATFGGVISVQGRFYGMTTAHSFLQDLRHSSEWRLFDGEGEAILSTAATATPPSTSIDTDSITDSEPGSIADALQNPLLDGEEFESLAYLQPLSNMAYSYQGMTMRPGGTPIRDPSMSDWALFPLQPSVALPNYHETWSLTSVTPEYQLTAGPVSILSGRDVPCEGYLTSPTASLHTEHALMDVREIMLKSKLPKGASGAWVVRGAQVCGYVVALIGEGVSCLMIPMERTFREIRELFDDDIEFGPELYDRIRENRPVDGVLEPLIAAARRAGEALREFEQNLKLRSGADLDLITAPREPKHSTTISRPSQGALLGGTLVEPIVSAEPEPLQGSSTLVSNVKPILNKTIENKGITVWTHIAEDAVDVSVTCGRRSDAFLKLALRSQSRQVKLASRAFPRILFHSVTFDRLFTAIAQDLNMMRLTWGQIGNWVQGTPSQWSFHFDTLQRFLDITRKELVVSTTSSMRLFPTENPSIRQAMQQATEAILWKGRLKEHRRSVKSLADDAEYLLGQCRRLPASQTTA